VLSGRILLKTIFALTNADRDCLFAAAKLTVEVLPGQEACGMCRMPGPKDILAERSASTFGGDKDETFIYTLQDGMYVHSTLDAAEIAEERKQKAIQEAEKLNDQGLELMKEGKYELADQIFIKASNRVAGEDPRYTVNIGLSDYEWGHYEDAAHVFGDAIEYHPQFAIAYLYRARTFKIYDGAEDHSIYMKSLKDVCHDIDHRCLADARKDYEKFLELAPNSKLAPEARQKLAALPASP
jgi:tetratricopeptide (TPR) repeat protein